MMDWVYLVLVTIGCVLVGFGGGGWWHGRNTRAEGPRKAPVVPQTHTPVGPTPGAVEEADKAADATSAKAEELGDRQNTLDASTPDANKPTEAGVAFLDSLDKP